MEIDDGYEVYLVFVFLDKMYRYQLLEDAAFECKYTGTNCIQHYLIPIKEMTEITEDEIKGSQEVLSPQEEEEGEGED